jgi:sortase A
MSNSQEMTRLKKALIGCQSFLLLIGFSALGYCALTVAETTLYQNWAYRQMRMVRGEFPTKWSEIEPSSLGSVLQYGAFHPSSLGDTSTVGRIEIPRLHISAMVAEGTTARVLRIAVGHISGTALPGQSGNVALAGHRDTFFRRLGDLKTGDAITLTTPRGQYVYGVRFTSIVSPDETWVLDPSTGQTLTLVTCYPFHFVGAAPKRFIVRASRLNSQTGEGPRGNGFPTKWP